MKNLTLIFTAFLIIILFSCNYKGIDRLEKSTLPYSKLPTEVKQHIFEQGYIDLNNPIKYKHVTRQHKYLHWIYESEIHRISDGRVFEMKTLDGEWGPFMVVINNYLYIPNHYNIYEKDSLNYTFSRFKLE